MISIIIPVYNVEQYLRKCLDSIVNQTYRDLEILIIDDGSTDGSGAICDEYKKDKRVKVCHTKNRGLSCARNLGLEEAKGEWISFVDSDDWIEPDMYEIAMSYIGSSEILCFSSYIEGLYNGLDALLALLNKKIATAVWGKLYKKECFSYIRFPEGRVYEDMTTTCRLLYSARSVMCVNAKLYHYCKRLESITRNHDMNNLIDFWIANKERYDYCMPLLQVLPSDQRNTIQDDLLESVALAISRAWGWNKANRPLDSPEWEKMSLFVRKMFPFHVKKHYSLRIRVGLFLARYNNTISFWLAYGINKMTRAIWNKII